MCARIQVVVDVTSRGTGLMIGMCLHWSKNVLVAIEKPWDAGTCIDWDLADTLMREMGNADSKL